MGLEEEMSRARGAETETGKAVSSSFNGLQLPDRDAVLAAEHQKRQGMNLFLKC